MKKNEIREIFDLYLNETKLADDVSVEELAELCDDLTGADVKSIVCDALVKAFHRAHKTLANCDDCGEEEFSLRMNSAKSSVENEAMQVELQAAIEIKREDLATSVEAVKKTVNGVERQALKRM
jgi:SpoVK/Ycf46/Vps4 family AAA+-type ATPase